MRHENLSTVEGLKQHWMLLMVMLIAAGVFAYGASTGATQSFYVDEWFYDRYAMELAQWIALRQPVTFSYIHPSGYSMTLGIIYGLFYLWGRLTGQFAGMTDFLVHFATQRADFIILGRLLSAGYALAALLLLYRLASRMFDRRVAVISVLAVAFSYPVVFYAHLAANITMLMFLTVAATYCIYCIWIRGKTSAYVWAGVFIGAGIGTKYYPALLFVPLGLAHVMRVGWSWRRPWKCLVEWHKPALAIALALVITVIFFPLPIFANDQWRYFFQDTLNYYTGGNPLENAWRLVAGNPTYWAQTTAEPVSWWANSLLVIGQVGLVWLGIGLLYGLVKFPGKWLILAMPFVTLFSYQALRGGLGLGVRQLYFALPLLWILAAAALVNILDRAPFTPSTRVGMQVITVILLMVQPVMWTARYLFLVSHPTTVEAGRAWLLENVPRDAVLLVDNMAAPFGETSDWREWSDQLQSVTGTAEESIRKARAAAAPFQVIELKGRDARSELQAASKLGQPVYVITTDYFSTGYWDPETIAAWGNLNLSQAPVMRQYYASLGRLTSVIWVATPRQHDALGPVVTISRIDMGPD